MFMSCHVFVHFLSLLLDYYYYCCYYLDKSVAPCLSSELVSLLFTLVCFHGAPLSLHLEPLASFVGNVVV